MAKLSRHFTVWPSRRRCSQRFDPMNPAPPVTRTFILCFDFVLSFQSQAGGLCSREGQSQAGGMCSQGFYVDIEQFEFYFRHKGKRLGAAHTDCERVIGGFALGLAHAIDRAFESGK